MAGFPAVCFAANQSDAYEYGPAVNMRFFAPLRAIASGLPPSAAIPPGFSWNPLGVAFDRSRWDFTRGNTWQSSILEPLLSLDSYDAPVFRLDHVERHVPDALLQTGRQGRMRPHHHYAASDGAEGGAVSQLYRDGFVKIDASWGIAPLLTDSLRSSISAKLPLALGAAPSSTTDLKDELALLLPHVLPRLTRLAKDYLGEDAELTLYKGSEATAYRLPATMPEHWDRVYPSGHWHHDRCGRRLKAIVFLQRVDEETHPTLVAAGSHETLYWGHGEFSVSRFSDRFVERSYRPVAMTGELGEGFVFDTNSVHRANVKGSKGRQTLVFEFNPRGKAKLLDQSPCGYQNMTKGSSRPRRKMGMERAKLKVAV